MAEQTVIRALKLAQSMGRDKGFSKSWVLNGIVSTLAMMGEFNKALRAVEEITTRQAKAEALADIAQSLAQAGEKDRAKETVQLATTAIQALKYPFEKIGPLCFIAKSLAQLGEKKTAVEMVNQALADTGMLNDRDTVRELSKIVDAFFQIGAVKKAQATAVHALETAETMSIYTPWNELDKAEAIEEAVQVAIEVGVCKEALKCWMRAYHDSHLTSVKEVLNKIASGAWLIAETEGGKTLWEIYNQWMEVEGWWSVQ